MIYSKISDLVNYKGIHSNLDIAIDAILDLDFEHVSPGKIGITEDVFINCFEYQTNNEDLMIESHYDFLDIHMVASGNEIVGVSDVAELTLVEEHEEDDYMVHQGEIKNHFHIKEGYALICFLNDAHMPKIMFEDKEIVKKIVAKIRVGN